MRAALCLFVVLCAGGAVAPSVAAGANLVRYSADQAVLDGSVRLRIERSGAATARRGERSERFWLSERRLQRVKRLLRRARFARLRAVYRAGGPPLAGGVAQRVRYRGRGVRVEAGADPPERLRRLLKELRQVFRRHDPAR